MNRKEREAIEREAKLEKLNQLQALLKERRERKTNHPLDFYVPLPHQARFHASKAKVRALIAANRAGKTETNVVEVCRHALGKNPHRPDFPVPNFGWVVSLSNEAQRDILQPKFEKYIGRSEIQKIRTRHANVWDQLILKNGSTIGFKSCEMGRQVLQGAALHWASFDEEPPRDVLDEVATRLVDHGGHWWMSFTPVNGMSWTYDFFADPDRKVKEAEVFTASMWDNAVSRGGHIPDADVRAYEDSISDPVMRRIRVYGEYHSQVGRIYNMWNRNVHLVETLPPHFRDGAGLKASFEVYVGLDTGRCFAAVFILVDYFGNLWIFDEYYNEGGTIYERARAIHNILSTYGSPAVTFIMDPSSQFFGELAEHGIVAQHANNDVEVGIPVMQEYMGFNPQRGIGWKYCNPRLYVVGPNCKRFLYEVERYQWEPPSKVGPSAGAMKSKPLKKDDHVMDSCRYVCIMRPAASRPPEGEDDDRPIELQIRDRVKDQVKQGRVGGNSEKNRGGDGFGLDSY